MTYRTVTGCLSFIVLLYVCMMKKTYLLIFITS